MGTSPQTTSSTQSPSPQVLSDYQGLVNSAINTANTPYSPYGGQMVAPLSSQTLQGLGGVSQYANAAQPYIGTAAGMAQGAASPVSPTPYSGAGMAQFMNPYTSSVVGATQAELNNQNQQQAQFLNSQNIGAGAFGGDRAGISQAVLANQQDLAEAPTIAGLNQSNYNQALAEFNTQQQTGLSAQEFNTQNLGNLANTYAGLGSLSQQSGLTGAQAQTQAGMVPQAEQQAIDTALMQLYSQGQTYPFQTTGWLGNIVEGVGSQEGGSATTTAPGPSATSQAAGAATAGLGALSSGAGIGSNLSGIGSALGGIFGALALARGGRIPQRGSFAFGGGLPMLPQRHGFAVGGTPLSMMPQSGHFNPTQFFAYDAPQTGGALGMSSMAESPRETGQPVSAPGGGGPSPLNPFPQMQMPTPSVRQSPFVSSQMAARGGPIGLGRLGYATGGTPLPGSGLVAANYGDFDTAPALAMAAPAPGPNEGYTVSPAAGVANIVDSSFNTGNPMGMAQVGSDTLGLEGPTVTPGINFQSPGSDAQTAAAEASLVGQFGAGSTTPAPAPAATPAAPTAAPTAAPAAPASPSSISPSSVAQFNKLLQASKAMDLSQVNQEGRFGQARGGRTGYADGGADDNDRFKTVQYQVPGGGRGNAPIYTALNLGSRSAALAEDAPAPPLPPQRPEPSSVAVRRRINNLGSYAHPPRSAPQPGPDPDTLLSDRAQILGRAGAAPALHDRPPIMGAPSAPTTAPASPTSIPPWLLPLMGAARPPSAGAPPAAGGAGGGYPPTPLAPPSSSLNGEVLGPQRAISGPSGGPTVSGFADPQLTATPRALTGPANVNVRGFANPQAGAPPPRPMIPPSVVNRPPMGLRGEEEYLQGQREGEGTMGDESPAAIPAYMQARGGRVGRNSGGVLGQMPLSGSMNLGGALGYVPQGQGVSGMGPSGQGLGSMSAAGSAAGGFGSLFGGGQPRQGYQGGGGLSSGDTMTGTDPSMEDWIIAQAAQAVQGDDQQFATALTLPQGSHGSTLPQIPKSNQQQGQGGAQGLLQQAQGIKWGGGSQGGGSGVSDQFASDAQSGADIMGDYRRGGKVPSSVKIARALGGRSPFADGGAPAADDQTGAPAVAQGPAPMPTRQQILAYNASAAQARGLDPKVVTNVLSGEMGAKDPYQVGDAGSSFGPWQLHEGGINPAMPNAGMGDDYVAATGHQPNDPSKWQEQSDFALDQMKQKGLTPWTTTMNKLGYTADSAQPGNAASQAISSGAGAPSGLNVPGVDPLKLRAAVDDAARPPDQKQYRPDFGQALMYAGFAMMAGRSPWAAVNIGEGAMKGLDYFQKQQELSRQWSLNDAQIAELKGSAGEKTAQTNLLAQQVALNLWAVQNKVAYAQAMATGTPYKMPPMPNLVQMNTPISGPGAVNLPSSAANNALSPPSGAGGAGFTPAQGAGQPPMSGSPGKAANAPAPAPAPQTPTAGPAPTGAAPGPVAAGAPRLMPMSKRPIRLCKTCL